MWSIGEQIARAESVLLCMEFDGVLAPEMEEESLVSLSPQMHRVLWSLLSQAPHHGFLSYRSRMELQMRIGLPDVCIRVVMGSKPADREACPFIQQRHFSKQLEPVSALLRSGCVLTRNCLSGPRSDTANPPP